MGGARCGVGELSITLAHACAFARFGGERERVGGGEGVREAGEKNNYQQNYFSCERTGVLKPHEPACMYICGGEYSKGGLLP